MWAQEDKEDRTYFMGSIWRRKGKEATLKQLVYHLIDYFVSGFMQFF